MNDHGVISPTNAAALLLWPLGLALILLDIFTTLETGQLGLFTTGGAMVCTINGFFCEQRDRERNAFEIGRDCGRAEARSPSGRR